MVKLDILSDPICPWCYIGKARLDRALEARPDHPFTIEWHPFQLNPDMPREGMDRIAYLSAKFGADRVEALDAQIREAARDAGLEIDYARLERTPNTLDAHRLIHWAGLEGRQTPVVSALFRANFTEGRDIGDPETLAGIAEAQGLDRAMILRLLASDADEADIRARDAHARDRGVTGVPTFVIANQHVVVGAQPTELWTRVIDDIAEQLRGAHAG